MLPRGWLACVLILYALPAPAPAQVQLTWKLKEGETFYLEETVTTKQSVTVNDSVTRQDMEQTRVSRFKVLKAAADGSAVLEQKIENVRVNNQGTGTKVEPALLKRLEGAVLTITLDSRQRVVCLGGYEKLIEGLARSDEDAAKLLRKVMPPESLQRPLDAVFGFGPAKSVSRGDKWEVKSAAPFGPLGTLRLTDTCTLQEVGKDSATVSVATAFDYEVPRPDSGAPLKVVSGDVKVKEARGTIHFDTAAGKLVRRDSHRELVVRLTLAGADLPNLSMSVEQQQTTTVHLREKNPLQK